jgi:hypothetical protein
MLMNGELSNRGVAAFPGSTLMEVLRRTDDDRTRIQMLYLRTLSRLPTPVELARLEELVGNAGTTDSDSSPRVSDGPVRRSGRPGLGRGPGGRFDLPVMDPKTQVFEDVFWALINSSEFVFNH